MYRTVFIAFILAIALAFMLGCSSNSPVDVPIQPSLDRTSESEGHVLLGYYSIYLDPSGPTAEVVPERMIEKHWNVKPYVLPPACMDCVQTVPQGPYNNKMLPVMVTLKNPQQVSGYDVRGIIISNDPGLTLVNPDNYSSLFDDGGDITINPFKAFATAVTNRKFGPGESYSALYNLYLETFGKVTKLKYAVDASWPGRAKEPYMINMAFLTGELDQYGLNVVTLMVDVFSAGDDVDEVTADLSSLGFTEEFVLHHAFDNTWESDQFSNTTGALPGQYACMISASTASSTLYLYNYISIPVLEGEPPISFADDIQPIFNEHCTSCHQTVGPPLDLDLSEGHAHSNLVDVDSEQSAFKRVAAGDPFFSYLFAKIMGIHEFAPFNGSGDRMPKNGPPWVPDEDHHTVTKWIMQGALDN